jgi:ribonuclease HIII
VTSYTIALSSAQAQSLRELLSAQGFGFADRPYMLFSAQKGKLAVSVYEKGPKVVIQGKETEDFVRFNLEPLILKEARLGYEEVLQPEMFEPHFGIDESGKGDFFGPLVVAGVYVDRPIARSFIDAGIMDSKRISSDARIKQLSDLIRKTPNIAVDLVVISPERYNQLYPKFSNLNDLLGWGHARAIENLLAQKPECRRSLSDKFANERIVKRSLMKLGQTIQVDQRTKAESDPAVAAASILARERFVGWLDRQSRQLGITLSKGVSEKVKDAAREILKRNGPESLARYAKLHFKTAGEVLS